MSHRHPFTGPSMPQTRDGCSIPSNRPWRHRHPTRFLRHCAPAGLGSVRQCPTRLRRPGVDGRLRLPDKVRTEELGISGLPVDEASNGLYEGDDQRFMSPLTGEHLARLSVIAHADYENSFLGRPELRGTPVYAVVIHTLRDAALTCSCVGSPELCRPILSAIGSGYDPARGSPGPRPGSGQGADRRDRSGAEAW